MTAQSDELRRQAAELEAQAARLETQLTQADVKTMFRDRRYSEIADAQANGRLAKLLDPTTTPKENQS
jgi:hypothetical protein